MISFIILIIFISIDTSILMFENGERIEKFRVGEALLHSLMFGIISMVMLLIGDHVINILYHEHIIRGTRFLKSIILLIKAATLLFEGLFHKQIPNHVEKHFNYRNSLEDAIIAGIDMFLIALCIFYEHIPIFVQCASVFIIMFVQVMLSLYIGYTQGHKFTKIACYTCFIAYFTYAAVHLHELFLH